MNTQLDPNEDDAGVLWAEIHRLRDRVAGPPGFSSWQEAATAERVRRVKAERELAAYRSTPADGPATPEDMKVYGAIADRYFASLAPCAVCQCGRRPDLWPQEGPAGRVRHCCRRRSQPCAAAELGRRG